jgi:aryl-alcohol dehydrogenase-like predicted oxidoreductase
MALPEYKWLRERLESPKGREQVRKAAELGQVAGELGATVSQLAIAWCLANSNVSTVILGATKPAQLREDLAALERVPRLDAAVLERIEAIFGTKPEPRERY